jgi:hypothetical protein
MMRLQTNWVRKIGRREATWRAEITGYKIDATIFICRRADQTSDTIDMNSRMGRAQNRTSACVSDQPRRTIAVGHEFGFMSGLHGRDNLSEERPLRACCLIPARSGRRRPASTGDAPPLHGKTCTWRARLFGREGKIGRPQEMRKNKCFLDFASPSTGGSSGGGVERFAPARWSLATRGGAIRSTPTPRRWRFFGSALRFGWASPGSAPSCSPRARARGFYVGDSDGHAGDSDLIKARGASPGTRDKSPGARARGLGIKAPGREPGDSGSEGHLALAMPPRVGAQGALSTW